MLAGLNSQISRIPFLSLLNPNNGFSSVEEEEGNYEVCLANISPAERRKRLKFGIVQFVIGLIVFAAMLVTGADKVWRLMLILPFGAAAAGFFQWRDKT